jgi:hypothetical protein
MVRHTYNERESIDSFYFFELKGNYKHLDDSNCEDTFQTDKRNKELSFIMRCEPFFKKLYKPTTDWDYFVTCTLLKGYEHTTINKTELQIILEKHREWLHTKGESGERADLSNADLVGYDLSEADLSEANLSGANLNYSKLRNTNLSKADLTRASLNCSDLKEANLMNANLQEVDFLGAS